MREVEITTEPVELYKILKFEGMVSSGGEAKLVIEQGQVERQMTNNDILRRVRYIFDFNDDKMIALFALADYEVTRAQISDWMKQEEDAAFKKLSDPLLAMFLNGLINDKRGKKDGPKPKPETDLSNNAIFMKLKIALSLQAEDILAIMDSQDFRMSKHELSAFFRKSGHKHYRECKDQILRVFLKGLQLKYRGDKEKE